MTFIYLEMRWRPAVAGLHEHVKFRPLMPRVKGALIQGFFRVPSPFSAHVGLKLNPTVGPDVGRGTPDNKSDLVSTSDGDLGACGTTATPPGPQKVGLRMKKRTQ